jgi:Flp pilus assembly CpaF family ATPase
VAVHSIKSEQSGPATAAFLEDPRIVEVMLNPDGRLWIDRLSSGLADTGERLSAADGERIVCLVAHHVGAEVVWSKYPSGAFQPLLLVIQNQ